MKLFRLDELDLLATDDLSTDDRDYMKREWRERTGRHLVIWTGELALFDARLAIESSDVDEAS